MEINIYLEAKKIEKDYKSALDEYTKRISAWCKLNLITVKNIEKVVIKKSAKTYIVSPSKETMSSPDLAELINKLNINGYSCINFIILPEMYVKDDATLNSILDISSGESFHISSFSMNSQLTTIVLSEQLYRAYTILNHITYHK